VAVPPGQPETLARYMLRVIERFEPMKRNALPKWLSFVQKRKKIHKTKIDSDMVKLCSNVHRHAVFSINTQNCFKKKQRISTGKLGVSRERNSMLYAEAGICS
jgi:hypothetical protein